MKVFLILLVLFFSSTGYAKDLDSVEQAQQVVEDFLRLSSKDKMREGLVNLKDYWQFPMAEFDSQLGQLDLQLPAIKHRFGNPVGYEHISTQKVGESLVQFVYVQKYDHHILKWIFIFYKPSDKWVLNTWYFNDKITSLFNY